MLGKKIRRKFTVEQKAAILRRHFTDKIPVPDLCDEYKIQPSMFYNRQKQMWENLAVALENHHGSKRTADRRKTQLEEENEKLKTKLAKKDNIIAEISEEYVQLKKELGEP